MSLWFTKDRHDRAVSKCDPLSCQRETVRETGGEAGKRGVFCWLPQNSLLFVFCSILFLVVAVWGEPGWIVSMREPSCLHAVLCGNRKTNDLEPLERGPQRLGAPCYSVFVSLFAASGTACLFIYFPPFYFVLKEERRGKEKKKAG